MTVSFSVLSPSCFSRVNFTSTSPKGSNAVRKASFLFSSTAAPQSAASELFWCHYFVNMSFTTFTGYNFMVLDWSRSKVMKGAETPEELSLSEQKKNTPLVGNPRIPFKKNLKAREGGCLARLLQDGRI